VLTRVARLAGRDQIFNPVRAASGDR